MFSLTEKIATLYKLISPSKSMTPINGMEIQDTRLRSFGAAQLPAKKRRSNAKGAKSIKWPHQTPSAEQVAITSLPDSDSSNVCSSLERDFSGIPPQLLLIIRCALCAIASWMGGSQMTTQSKSTLAYLLIVVGR